MDKQRRLQKFSIRKYTVGACSILVGTLIFLSSPTHHAFASENTVDATKLEVTEKEKENEVTKAEKEVEEAVNTTEATSTNQSATDESTEQSKSKEIGKQQVEQEKVDSIAESSKPEEAINKLEVKNEIDNKQEVPVKQATVEEMEIPKVDEASQPAAVTPEVKENKNHNDAVKSELKTVAKENEQVQKEVVSPEIKEHSQTEKKTTESEQKLDKTETPNKTAVAVKQSREERSIRTRRELRSADDSAPRENVNNDTSSDNFVITGKAFGKKANDQEVSDYAHIAHSYVKENGDNVEFHYVIHFNKAESNKARGRFYVYAPSFVKLTPGSIQRVTGSGTFNNWKNKALVTGGSKLNSMVYQAMIPVDRDYYRNLTKITDEDNFYYIHEELNHRRNSYIAKMTATVSKDILRKNNGKFYVAIGVATENIARANRANHVNFIENRANVSDADKFNPKGKEQTVELNEIPNAEQSINTSGLPNGTKYVYTSPVDTSTIGNKNTTVRVSYPDGTHDVVPVVLVVNDTIAPVGPTIENQSIEKDKAIDPITIPNATDNSGEIKPTSVTGLPTGLNYNNQTNQITGTSTVEGTNDVTVTYTDTSGNTVTKVFQLNITDTTPPAKPVIQTDLTGKGGTTEPITVQAEPGSKVELFDKDGNKIGEGIADDQGNAVITPTKPLPEGNVTAKATDKAENPNTSEASEPIKVTDTTAPAKPVIQTDLTGKGGTTDPITVQAEPGSKVELFDKDGNKIGEGTADDQGNAVITPTKPLSEGNITAKATDKAENPNTSEASDSIMVTNPKDTDDTTDNQDSDINGDGKNNKDESNPSASTPTNNDGDVQPDATTPSQNPSNNSVDEKPGNKNGSDQPNTAGNEQTNNGDGVNNKDEDVTSTDPTNSDSNGNGISDGGEDADKDDISNKDESNTNNTTSTDNDGDGQPDVTKPSQDSNNNGSNQPNTGNNNPNNADQHKDTNNDSTPNNQDSDIESNGVNNKDEETEATDPTESNSNDSGISNGDEDSDKDDISNKDESNTNNTTSTDNDGDAQPDVTKPSQDSNNNPNNADQHKDTNNDSTPNNQDSDIESNGVDNKDEETEATDPTESNSNDSGISNGDEDSDKDGISNKDESDSNSTIPTDKDVNGQSNTGNNNPNNTVQYKDTNNDNTPNNQDSDIESNGVNNKDEEVASTDPTDADTNSNGISDGGEDADKDDISNKDESNPNASAPTNNNDSGQSNTGDDNPNNADQSKDTDGDGTSDNQDTDIDGDGINNINKEISGTNPMNSDTKENGALSDEKKSVDSKSSIQPNIDGNVMTNNSNITDKQSMNKYDKLNSNNDIIKLAAKDDISSEGNGVTNINYELNNGSSISQQNSNTNLNDQNATNDMSNNNQSSKAHSNTDHEDAKVLPDTGEKESKLAGLLGITSLFGGLTLLFRRKKSEDKE